LLHRVRKIVEQLTKGGNTVNFCSVDLSKAFDKVNHFGMYIKLMKRLIPTELLALLENWIARVRKSLALKTLVSAAD